MFDPDAVEHTFLHRAFSKQSFVGNLIPFVVDVALVHLQLLRLRRFGPSAASDSDQLIVHQSEIRS